MICEIVVRAQKMGAYVIVADYLEDSPAKKIADEAVLIDATDVDAIVDYCQKAKIDGLTTGFVDILLQPCYEACKRLGLPCYLTPKLIDVSTNKVSFKEACKEYNVPVPQTYFIGEIIPKEIYDHISYPVFVKPMDASGSRGAGVCYNREELDNRFTEAVGYSVTKNAIIEDFITGREFLMNYVAQNGEFRMISMFDRYSSSDRNSAINYASLSFGPSKAVDYYLNEVNEKVVNMFKSLGFKDGIYFLQGYSNGNKVTFFEMGCRLGGSYSDLEREIVGIDPVAMLVRYALTGKMGDNIISSPINIGKYKKIGVCVNYLLSGKEGTIHTISGLDKIQKLSSLVFVDQVLYEGYHFESATIMLGCNENGEYIQEELRKEGNTYFARYSIAANSETMIGYEVIYRNEEGQYVSIYDQLSESDTEEEHLFSFPGEYVYRAENIPDMEYAISMQGNDHNSLCMMKILRNPIVCRWYPEKTKIDDQDGMMPDYFTYQSEQIDISSNAIDIEVLVSMFSK